MSFFKTHTSIKNEYWLYNCVFNNMPVGRMDRAHTCVLCSHSYKGNFKKIYTMI